MDATHIYTVTDTKGKKMEDAPILEDQDVAEEEVEVETEETEQPLSQRDEVVKRIQERERQEREPAEEEEEDLEEEIEDEPEPEEPEVEYVTVTVNGREQKVEKSKVLEQGIKTYQKESAADLRLREAAERQRELDRREAELRQLLEKTQAPDNQVSELKERLSKALLEDEEEAATIIADAVAYMQDLDNRTKALAEDYGRSKEIISKQQRSEREKLQSLFKREFSDLAQDPFLANKVNARTAEILAESPDMPHDEIVLKAGNEVREYLAGLFGKEEAPEPDPETVKRKMPRQPKRAAGRKPGKEEPRPKTTAEIIADMAQKRSPYK